MINELLINLVDNTLGRGKRTSGGNKAYKCPYCDHPKLKLEINFTENKKGNHPWHCWVCNQKGSRISTLFKKVKASSSKFNELQNLVKNERDYEIAPKTTEVSLPKEFISLSMKSKDIIFRHAFNYVKKRGITLEDIERYNIGYCPEGEYQNMIIIPSYDENGNLNFFTARSFQKNSFRKYKNPEVSRDIIPFELFINWDLPIVLCEGPFDAIAIRRNVIPLLGNRIQQKLLKKIITSKVDKIYIALDKDALKHSLKMCKYFMDEGKEVYLVELDGKDPSDLGFRNFTEIIQNTIPLTPYQFMIKKLELV